MTNPLNVEEGEIIEVSDHADFEPCVVGRFESYLTKKSGLNRFAIKFIIAEYKYARRIPEVNYKNPMPGAVWNSGVKDLLKDLPNGIVDPTVGADYKTLRDEFAMAANEADIRDFSEQYKYTREESRYRFADEMMKARKVEK